MRLDQFLDDAVYKWFCQLRSSGLAVCGAEIQATSERLAKKLNTNSFKANWGLLFRFIRRHNITNKKYVVPTMKLLSHSRKNCMTFKKLKTYILRATVQL